MPAYLNADITGNLGQYYNKKFTGNKDWFPVNFKIHHSDMLWQLHRMVHNKRCNYNYQSHHRFHHYKPGFYHILITLMEFSCDPFNHITNKLHIVLPVS